MALESTAATLNTPRDRAPAGAFSLRRETFGLSITVALIVLLFLLSFGRVLFSGDAVTIAGLGDTNTLNGPKAYFLDVRLKQGEFPLWDPLTLTGMPYAAHPLAQAFYPPNLIRAYLDRPTTAVDFYYSIYFYILFHLIIAGTGFYLLARREGVTVPVSILIAVAVPYSERWLVNAVTQLPMLCTVAWIPLILWCLREAGTSIEWRRRTAWACVAGIFYGLQILAGWPEAAIYATVAYLVYLLLTVAFAERHLRFSSRMLGRLILGAVWPGLVFGLVGALVGLALILPATELISLSGRSGAHFSKFASVGAMINFPTSYSLALHRAKFGTGPSSYLYSIPVEYDQWFSLNLALLLVAFSSFFFVKQRRVRIFTALAYLFLDLTYGPPFPVSRLFETFSPFASSTPTYISMLVSIPLGLLAGFALDGIVAGALSGPFTIALRVFFFVAGVPMVWLATEPPDYVVERSFGWGLLPATVIALIVLGQPLRHWRILVISALAAETAICAPLIIYRSTERPGTIMVPFLSDPEILTHAPDPELRRPRVVCKPCNHHVWALESSINGYDPLALFDSFDALANPGEERIYRRGPDVEKNLRAAALFSRPFWLVPAVVRAPAPDKTRPFPPTSAVFINSTARVDLPELKAEELPLSFVATPGPERVLWTPADAGAQNLKGVHSVTLRGVALSRRNQALRLWYRCVTASTLNVRVSGDTNVAQRYRLGPVRLPPSGDVSRVFEVPLPHFESGQVYVSVQPDAQMGPQVIERLTVVEDAADEIDRIHVTRSNANDVELAITDLPASRALVFTEMNCPGWSATVDGRPVAILPAYGSYKAVVVSAGTHEVTFRYRPWRVAVGVTVSLLAMLLTIVTLVTLFLRAYESSPRTESRLSD